MGWGSLGAFGWIGMVGMLMFWFGLIALVVWGLSRVGGGRGTAVSSGPPEDAADRILAERFARGEITDAEYQQAKEVLGGTAQ